MTGWLLGGCVIVLMAAVVFARRRRVGARVLACAVAALSLPSASRTAPLALAFWAMSSLVGFVLGMGLATHRLRPHAGFWMVVVVVMASALAWQTLVLGARWAAHTNQRGTPGSSLDRE